MADDARAFLLCAKLRLPPETRVSLYRTRHASSDAGALHRLPAPPFAAMSCSVWVSASGPPKRPWPGTTSRTAG